MFLCLRIIINKAFWIRLGYLLNPFFLLFQSNFKKINLLDEKVERRMLMLPTRLTLLFKA